MNRQLDTIWKFKVPREIRPVIEMPQGAKILSFQIQDGQAVLWALVNPGATVTSRLFFFRPTGQQGYSPISEMEFIGTVQYPDGLVYHLFEQVLKNN